MEHGLLKEANMLADKWIQMYEISGVYEMYNPLNATGYGVPGLGMSTVIVDVIARTKGL